MGGREEMRTGFGWGNLREGDDLEDPCIDGRIILKWTLKTLEWTSIDVIKLAEDRDRWRALLNALIKLRVP
jgi:hypothetical protein